MPPISPHDTAIVNLGIPFKKALKYLVFHGLK